MLEENNIIDVDVEVTNEKTDEISFETYISDYFVEDQEDNSVVGNQEEENVDDFEESVFEDNEEKEEIDEINEYEGFLGNIKTVKDGIAFVSKIEKASVGDIVEIISIDMIEAETNEEELTNSIMKGMVLSLNPENIGVIIFGEINNVSEGDLVYLPKYFNTFKIEIGNVLGRIINPLGEALDGKGKITAPCGILESMTIESKAPGVITRDPIKIPLLTGYKVIDALFPIGRGQRELIIGDRKTGKTTLAIDTIINQNTEKNSFFPQVFCIYVAIGQKQSSIREMAEKLEKYNAMKYTTIVAATASDAASLQFVAPYVGCAIGEWLMKTGRDALIVYDDLTKHAIAYRQLSLLLRRPPGREAYPGDIFYIHSRLLERAAKLNQEFGSGSLTALPIIETQAGDVSGYIPTNVISITDGQIFLDRELFFKGIRPAVNIGTSVSRVGSAAQVYILKEVSKGLRLDLSQYREYSIFSKFDSDIDEVTRNILARGNLLTKILQQPPHAPLDLFNTILSIFSATGGFLNSINVDHILLYETILHNIMLIEDFEKTFFWVRLNCWNIDSAEDFDVLTTPLALLINSSLKLLDITVVLLYNPIIRNNYSLEDSFYTYLENLFGINFDLWCKHLINANFNLNR